MSSIVWTAHIASENCRRQFFVCLDVISVHSPRRLFQTSVTQPVPSYATLSHVARVFLSVCLSDERRTLLHMGLGTVGCRDHR